MSVESVTRRIVLGIAMVGAMSVLMTPGSAVRAAPPPGPTSVTISGDGIAEPLTVRAESNATLFAAILDQVSWLHGKGQTSPPKDDELGPKYTVVVLVNGAATQTYDLYPLASGGPRAFRPAQQPDLREATGAWFFGRLNMSSTLRAAGAPLPEKADVLSGGIGGGERVIPQSEADQGEQFHRLLGDMRRLVLLNGAVVLVIAAGVAGIALRIRRRTR